MSLVDVAAEDLLGLTAALVDVPSISRAEGAIADGIEQRIRTIAGLDVRRFDDNVVASTARGLPRRVVLAGHIDTVPAAGNETAVVEGDTLRGLGSTDMKGGVAVMVRLAEELARTGRHDLTFVFYASEEVADEHNGLRHLFADHANLVEGDLAVLLEPTGGVIEAGCQGTLRMQATFRGARAHTARPWMGENAIHKAGPVLQRIAEFSPPEVEVDGLTYRESLQVVYIEGGVAGNVVPDECAIVVNRRFAPARTFDQAVEEVRAMLGGADEITFMDGSDAAAPNLAHPLVAEAVAAFGTEVRPKLGWTDVARFSAHGIPAFNFGPGDPELAHTPGEFVTRQSLEDCYTRLATFLA